MQPGQAPKLGFYTFGCAEFGSKIAALATGSLAAQTALQGFRSWLDEVPPLSRRRIRAAKYCNAAKEPTEQAARDAYSAEMQASDDKPLKREYFLVRSAMLRLIQTSLKPLESDVLHGIPSRFEELFSNTLLIKPDSLLDCTYFTIPLSLHIESDSAEGHSNVQLLADEPFPICLRIFSSPTSLHLDYAYPAVVKYYHQVEYDCMSTVVLPPPPRMAPIATLWKRHT